MRRVLRAAGDLLLPRVCVACARAFDPGEETAGWCADCLGLISCRAPRCPRCAREGQATTCPVCLASPPGFSRTLLLGNYSPPLDGVIRALKFSRQPALARALGEALADHVGPALAAELSRLAAQRPSLAPPRVLAVPISPERLASRGYNQALLIARAFAARLGLPVDAGGLARVRPGPPQSSLDPAARERNARDAYAARIPPESIAIVVDDVITTGATLSASARALRDAGAAAVINAVIARPPHVSRGPGPP
jgi:ComF family protein